MIFGETSSTGGSTLFPGDTPHSPIPPQTMTLPHSSGAVEGNVNRIKMIKRQMYSRAGFGLLRKRVPRQPDQGAETITKYGSDPDQVDKANMPS